MANGKNDYIIVVKVKKLTFSSKKYKNVTFFTYVMAIVPRSRRERVFCNFRVCTVESAVFLSTTIIARFTHIASSFALFFTSLSFHSTFLSILNLFHRYVSWLCRSMHSRNAEKDYLWHIPMPEVVSIISWQISNRSVALALDGRVVAELLAVLHDGTARERNALRLQQRAELLVR